jgi:hypothetical protein
MGQLLNLIGLSTGITRNAMLRAIIINTADTSLASSRLDPLLRATVVLRRGWSLCSLTAYDREIVSMGPMPRLAGTGDSAFGSPSVIVVHCMLGWQEAR